MLPSEKLLIATNNSGKLREIRRLLGDVPLTIIGPDALAAGGRSLPAVTEAGETYAENALLKARSAARATGLAALADDSGLEVDALDGAPGVHSARFAGPAASDADNNRLLLARLYGVPPARRAARFVCTAALVLPDGREIVTTGSVEGRIVDAPRGEGGFGYDPLFFYEPFGCTFGEVSAEAKNGVSHRARAVAAMAERISALIVADAESAARADSRRAERKRGSGGEE